MLEKPLTVCMHSLFYDVKLIFQEENFCQMLSNFRVEEALKGPQLLKSFLYFSHKDKWPIPIKTLMYSLGPS